MAMQKKKDAITKLGGGDIQVLEVTDEGVLVEGSTWKALGYIESSTLKDDTTQEENPDETGATVNVDDVKRTVVLSGNLMQTDKDLLDFLKEGCRGKYYAVYQKAGTVEGNVQEIFYGITRIKPSIELTSGTKRPPFTITALKNAAAIAFGGDGLTMPSTAEALSATVAIDEHYYIASTAADAGS